MADIERLRQLRRVVEAAPEDRLHMRHWCEKAECGTAYCAAGWTAIDPWFQENTIILDLFLVRPDGKVEPQFLDVTDKLAGMFKIKRKSARHLFGLGVRPDLGPHSVTKAEVLENIDRLIGGLDAKPYAAAQKKSPEAVNL